MKKKLLNVVSMLLVVCTLLSSLFACKPHECKFNQRIIKDELFVAEANYEHANLYKLSCECGKVSDTQTFQVGSLLKYEVGSRANLLDGKKVLIIGNSLMYYGNCVIKKDRTITDIESRQNDHGYFYYMCKSNGAEVSVTNWCYGGHNFYDSVIGEECKSKEVCDGFNHSEQLTDRTYDYVIIQDTDNYLGNNVSDERYIDYFNDFLDIFREHNPEVKFIFTTTTKAVYDAHLYNGRTAIAKLENAGMPVADWGTLCYDIWSGAVEVPNSQVEYTKSTFIVPDGIHTNVLSGYITALMIYCAITGETAVGQDYTFATNASLDITFNPMTFMNKYYNHSGSNFDIVLESETEMRGIQQLVDQYIRTQQYTRYFN